MNWKKITFIFIATVIVTSIGYDALTIIKGGLETSISHTIIMWSYEYPVFTFLTGFIMGHLFWRLKQTSELEKINKQ